MVDYPINSNKVGTIQSSLPLAPKRIGEGLGFKFQSTSSQSSEVLIDISRSSKNRLLQKSKESASKTLEALEDLGKIGKQISILNKNLESTLDAKQKIAINSELSDLSEEFQRIAKSKELEDLKKLAEGDSKRETLVDENLKILQGVSLSSLKENPNLAIKIKEAISNLKTSLTQVVSEIAIEKTQSTKAESPNLPVPFLSLKTAGTPQGLSVSLLGFSNQDLIKAAASHLNLESTNVLVLTFNAPEPETELEKRERESNSKTIEIEYNNPKT